MIARSFLACLLALPVWDDATADEKKPTETSEETGRIEGRMARTIPYTTRMKRAPR